MPGIITSSTTRSGKRSRARRQASSPSDASITSSFGSIDRRWRVTSSNIVGSSSATSTIGGAAFAFTMTMIEELDCFGQVLSFIGRLIDHTSVGCSLHPDRLRLVARRSPSRPERAARRARSAPSLVDEERRHAGRRLDELLVRGHVLHHRGHVTLRQLELVLHHSLGGIEQLADHFLPPRVRGNEHERRPVGLFARDQRAGSALALVHVEPHGHVRGEADRRVGGDDHGHCAVRPVLRGSLVAGAGVDGVSVGRAPFDGGKAERRCARSVGACGHEAREGTRAGRPGKGALERQGRSRSSGDGARLGTRRYLPIRMPPKTARRIAPTAGPRVHERGNKRLDGVLDFVAFAARPMPLLTLLDEAPRRIVSLLEAEVCSLYLLEGDKSELVMRGNVGLSNAAIGQVRLRVGQGITGESIEYMRPISTETAEQHGAYKHFAGIGEERFPVFLAVPFRGKAGPLGAVVVQRSAVPFTEADIELLALVGGLIAAGSRHAELVDEARERRARRTGGGTRKVTLAGRPVVVGRALGAVAALRRPPRRPEERPNGPEGPHADAHVRRLRGAFDVAEKAIHGLRERAGSIGLAADAQFLSTYVEILEDMRFRERATELVASGAGVAQALSKVARAVTRAAASVTRDSFLEERARDIEDLCDALTMLADTDRRSALPSKAVLLGDTLTVFDLLVSARSMPTGIALTERASGPRTRVLLKLMNIPAVADVKG